MGYIEQAALAQDETFLNQIRIATMSAAVAVQGEDQGAMSSDKFGKRQALSFGVLDGGVDDYLWRFSYAVAQNPAVTRGAPVVIVSSAANVVTSTGHGLTTGNVIVIKGHVTNTAINGAWTVTVLTANTFSVPVIGVAAGTAGSFVKMPSDSDIQFTVDSVWDDIAGVISTE